MFGDGHTYFADSPVVIDISGLQWPPSSPFNVVRVEVNYNGAVVGTFSGDTGRQSSISFDISSALRAIWADYDYSAELAQAGGGEFLRSYRAYTITVYTEYLDSTDGEFTTTSCGEFTGGQCMTGHLTEWERANVGSKENADASYWEHSNSRFGDASTKPHGPSDAPERVGCDSITTWTDVSNSGTKTVFYPKGTECAPDDYNAHAPLVLRDSIPYMDFLFKNRRGAIESCSALMKEGMSIGVETSVYTRVERPSFKPSRTVMTVASDGRRSWQMSSGYVTREWAEWWALEFLTAERVWMLWKGSYVPVIVEPAKKSTDIYDRSKQQMPSVEFTVTLALEG